MKIMEHLEKLGKPAKDSVTGFKGVISSVGFDLYGCVQVVITPETDKEGKVREGHWFDISRIVVTGKKPVMPVPNYEYGYIAEGKKGAAEKPVPF